MTPMTPENPDHACSPSSNGSQPALTPYEAEQVRRIAAWKSTGPSRITAAIDAVTVPIAWAVRRVVPRSVVRRAIDLIDRLAETRMSSWKKTHLADGGWDLPALRRAPLEECDRLAMAVIREAEHISAGRGLVMRQFGSAVVGRLPFQLVTTFTMITKLAHCYGYALDRPVDRAMLFDLLDLGLTEQPPQRGAILERLHAALDAPDGGGLDSDTLAVQAGRDVVADELADELVARIPLVGGMVGFITDRTFLETAGESAMRFFQERHLRDAGRVAAIAPSGEGRRKSTAAELGHALGQTLYAGGAIVGFTATFPVAATGRVLSWWRGPITVGAADGSAAALRTARGLLDSAERVRETSGTQVVHDPARGMALRAISSVG